MGCVGSGSAILSVAIQTPIEAWKTSAFGAGAANQAVSGELVVANGAGVGNLMAYALGANPFAAQAADLPVPSLKLSNGSKYLSLQFHRNTTATDISYVVESGTNPGISGSWSAISTFSNGGWLPSANVTESGSGAQVNVEAFDPIPTTSSPSRFLRLKVIH